MRTYVTRDGKPGIWFFSLDATSRAAVEAARRAYRLPYHHMRATYEERGLYLRWRSSADRRAAAVRLRGDLSRRRRARSGRAGLAREFLTERYCLYASHRGTLYRAEIHHAPWPLQAAELELDLTTMTPDGIDLPAAAPLAHFSTRQDVVLWRLERA